MYWKKKRRRKNPEKKGGVMGVPDATGYAFDLKLSLPFDDKKCLALQLETSLIRGGGGGGGGGWGGGEKEERRK